MFIEKKTKKKKRKRIVRGQELVQKLLTKFGCFLNERCFNFHFFAFLWSCKLFTLSGIRVYYFEYTFTHVYYFEYTCTHVYYFEYTCTHVYFFEYTCTHVYYFEYTCTHVYFFEYTFPYVYSFEYKLYTHGCTINILTFKKISHEKNEEKSSKIFFLRLSF